MSWAKPEDAAKWQRDFGLRLREVRLAKGYSQMQLALAADMDPTYLSAVEQGRRNISLVNIHALAGTLEVSVRKLFDP
ncbi:MAG: helix-turn-helix domain-containing protein [Actinomycetota bacterium]|nr:helix-turn-helix domain-containing protein [Actinomycetota bacterium]